MIIPEPPHLFSFTGIREIPAGRIDMPDKDPAVIAFGKAFVTGIPPRKYSDKNNAAQTPQNLNCTPMTGP
jgi:hypothetical protein